MVSFQNKLVAIGNLYLIYIFAMKKLPNKLMAISSIETIYLIYMFNFFKTKINFAHKISHFKNKFIHHPIGKPNKSKNMICKFGKVTSWIFALYLLLRHQNFNRFVNIRVIFFGLLLSLMNLNATIYLLPIFLIEYRYISKLKLKFI